MAFIKGNKHGKGRRPGSKNKITDKLLAKMEKWSLDKWTDYMNRYEAADTLMLQQRMYENIQQYILAKKQAVTSESKIENMSEEQMDVIINRLIESNEQRTKVQTSQYPEGETSIVKSINNRAVND